ncbi:MAG: DUF6588 family protein [Ignavibacteriaceae bacterium]
MKKVIILGLLIVQFTLFGQVENYLGQLSEKDVDAYAKPLVTTIGIAMNTGLYRTAKIEKSFGFSVAINTVYLIIPEDQRSFLPSSLDPAKGYDNTQKVSTIFGSTKSTVFTGDDGFKGFPGGFDLTHATFILPQIEASYYHTKLMLRFVPSITIVDEKFSLLSIGIKHSLGQYFDIPVDGAVHVIYNSFSVSDMISSSNMAFGISASKTFGLITPYAGLQIETSTTNFEYKKTVADQQVPVKTEVTGDNAVKFTLGAELRYGILGFNVDFNFGSQNNAAAGLSFNF